MERFMPEKIKKPLLRYWLAAVFLSMLVIGGYTNAVLYQVPRILTEIRLRAQDRYFKARLSYNEHFRKDLTKESAVVLIAIDNESMAEFKQGPSTNKKFIARIIDKAAEYSPKVIVLDILFSNNNGDNLVVAEAIKKAGNVIIAYSSNSGLDKVDRAVLTASLHYGCADIIPMSEDNIRRTFIMQSMFGPFAVPLEAALIYRNIPLKEVTLKGQENSFIMMSKNETIDIPVKEYGEALINYLYTEKSIPTISAHKLLEGNFAPSILKNKIAILCVTADTSEDIHNTPIGKLPGGVIMANITNSIVHSDYLIEFPIIITWAIQILLGAILAVLFYKTSFLRSLVILIAAVLGSLAVSISFFWHNIVWSAFDIMVIAFLLHVVISYHKLIILEAERNQD
jgi:CHASE2 domain-containing sensor protein